MLPGVSPELNINAHAQESATPPADGGPARQHAARSRERVLEDDSDSDAADVSEVFSEEDNVHVVSPTLPAELHEMASCPSLAVPRDQPVNTLAAVRDIGMIRLALRCWTQQDPGNLTARRWSATWARLDGKTQWAWSNRMTTLQPSDSDEFRRQFESFRAGVGMARAPAGAGRVGHPASRTWPAATGAPRVDAATQTYPSRLRVRAQSADVGVQTGAVDGRTLPSCWPLAHTTLVALDERHASSGDSCWRQWADQLRRMMARGQPEAADGASASDAGPAAQWLMDNVPKLQSLLDADLRLQQMTEGVAVLQHMDLMPTQRQRLRPQIQQIERLLHQVHISLTAARDSDAKAQLTRAGDLLRAAGASLD